MTYTGAAVLDGLVGARELREVVARHFGLDFDGVENLTKNKKMALVGYYKLQNSAEKRENA